MMVSPTPKMSVTSALVVLVLCATRSPIAEAVWATRCSAIAPWVTSTTPK